MIENNLSSTGKIFTANGFDLYYETHGSGTPLLLLHGFSGSCAGLASMFSPFLDTHQLIVPDLRGHGRSTNPSKKFTFKQAATDIFSLLQNLNIDACHAVGFSGGGCTLLHMATQKPDSIRSMALVSATTHFLEQTRELMRQFTVESRTTADWESMRQKHHHGDEQIQMLWEQANAFSESYNDMNFSPKLLSTITSKGFSGRTDKSGRFLNYS